MAVSISILRVAAVGSLVLSLVCGLLFYQSYLKWISLFENGRYFDPETAVVHHESGAAWGIFTLGLAVLTLGLWFAARWMQRQR